MHYQITRNGQTYGPYTLDDLQRYLGTGNVLATDLVKSDDMADWVPVSQLLAAQPAPVAEAFQQPVSTVYTQPAFADPAFSPVAVNPVLAGSPYPDAPNLHWGLVILFSVLSCGLFTMVWDIIIAAWLRRVQPSDTSMFWYLGAIGLRVFRWLVALIFLGLSVNSRFYGSSGWGSLLAVATFAIIITANFIKRASLEEHFNGPEPVGLQLSGGMTFFFAPWYFQYHLNRINALKQAARYGAPRAF